MTSEFVSAVSAIALLVACACGCDKTPATGSAAVSSAGPPAASSVVRAAVSASAPPAPSAAPSAAAAKDSPSLEAMFLGAPAPETRRSETVTGAGGVYAGLPPGWSTQDVYNAYLIALTKEAKGMAYLVMGTRLDDKELDGFVKSAAYPIYLKDVEWDSGWADAKVGPASYTARVRRGHGKSIYSDATERSAVAVGVEVPGRKTIYVLGSWNEPAPEVERQFVEIVRGIGRCKHKPNRGCVAVQPTGAEEELPAPPKSAPGSSPFGG